MRDELVELIVRLGRNNRRWGACASMARRESPTSGSRPARCAGSRAGAASDPGRGTDPRGPSSCVPRVHKVSATDFFTVEIVWSRQLYVLFVIYLSTREV
jgi:hypothetical protein